MFQFKFNAVHGEVLEFLSWLLLCTVCFAVFYSILHECVKLLNIYVEAAVGAGVIIYFLYWTQRVVCFSVSDNDRVETTCKLL
jgi:hypothetical protein